MKKGSTAYYYRTATCDGSTRVGALPSCSTFHYTGVKRAVDCGFHRTCFVQMKLTAGAADTYWASSHTCSESTTIFVEEANTDCMPTPREPGAPGLTSLQLSRNVL